MKLILEGRHSVDKEINAAYLSVGKVNTMPADHQTKREVAANG